MKNVALITGASSGIGLELARIHAKSGGDLIIVSRNREKLNEVKNELLEKYNVKVFIIIKDLSVAGSGQEVYKEVRKEGVEIDYLINNAGFGGLGKFHEREWSKDRAMIALNITALTELTRMFLPGFVDRNSGKILNVSSTASFMPGPLQAVYYATKAYVTFFSNALSEELYDTKVTVTNLMPGATETQFGKVSGMNKTKMFQKTASARSVAEDGYQGMLDGKIDVISGITLGQKLMMKMIPFMTKKSILKTIRKMQEV